MKKPVVIDLFAGAGGLSCGFLQTNNFEIKVAVENNKNAQNTYKKNHANVYMEPDIRKVDFSKLKEEFGHFDIVIGGPPCQGFSNANRQKNELVSGNNQLVKEYIKAVEELQPSVFVMENVKTIGCDKHKFFCAINQYSDIMELGVKLKTETILIAETTSVFDKFLKFLKSSDNFDTYTLSKENHMKINTIFRNTKTISQFEKYMRKHETLVSKLLKVWDKFHKKFWCNEYGTVFLETKDLLEKNNISENEFNDVKEHLKIIIETNKAMYKVQEMVTYNIERDIYIQDDKNITITVKTYNVIEYVIKKMQSLGYEVEKGVLNAAQFGVPQVRERLIIIGIKKESLKVEKVTLPEPVIILQKDYFNIGDAIKDLVKYETSTSVESEPIKKRLSTKLNPLQLYLNDSEYVHNHVNTDTRETALKRFENLQPGQNFHHLSDSLKTTYSDPSRTQNTIYQRLDYGAPSGTVLNVRKSMWVHPKENRAISIREAARLQAFPDSFIFCGTKDSQYQQVGNAVPPLLGRAIAEKVLELLGIDTEEKLEKIISVNSNRRNYE